MHTGRHASGGSVSVYQAAGGGQGTYRYISTIDYPTKEGVGGQIRLYPLERPQKIRTPKLKV